MLPTPLAAADWLEVCADWLAQMRGHVKAVAQETQDVEQRESTAIVARPSTLSLSIWIVFLSERPEQPEEDEDSNEQNREKTRTKCKFLSHRGRHARGQW
ncbi:hypothetical protein PoB_005348000 [Plakobranchus ocellatus]|uniref:Uncharacterized protein n=1 Tax=Plakobranchus ocellatus TaxID=259542 RepID=A0AAV4C5L8_9GAST|nr:hypothetical protein PoB_005348000 [Plakobranchus ocellatus]